MLDQLICIPSGSIGEIEFVPEVKSLYKTEAARLNEDKAMPLMKLFTDLVDAISKYHRNQTRIRSYENYPPLAVDIWKTASKLPCSFKKVKELTDELLLVIFKQLTIALKYIGNIEVVYSLIIFYGMDGKLRETCLHFILK